MDKIDGLAASEIVSSALLASLAAHLKRLGLLTDQDERQIYRDALKLIESRRAASPPDMAPVYEAARETIEDALR